MAEASQKSGQLLDTLQTVYHIINGGGAELSFSRESVKRQAEFMEA